MKAKYVIFGNGLLGSTFANIHDAVVIPRSVCDITDRDSIRSTINYYKPRVVINTAGIVPKYPAPISQMFKVNSFAPHYIADVCFGKCKFIHISTNCVFDGERGAYTERDEASATDVYGMSKLFGESSDALVIRTSFVGLPDLKGRGLLAWLSQHTSVVGYDKVLWNGVTTLELVSKVLGYAELDLTGIRHVYSYTISKYHLLQLVNEILFDNTKIVDKESDMTNSPHIEDKTLNSVYATGFISKPIKQQVMELTHAIKR
jgi:dTDP-4-dehydrorhamnose reductase